MVSVRRLADQDWSDSTSVSSPGGSGYQSTKTAQIRLNDFLMSEYVDKVSTSARKS